uniref:ATP synthase F0 subunit 8 n=1 Tax=Ixodes crenulatus TaxID=2755510 RepID=UPI002E782394|nr:ATP synthase F0 subunit 8 [Ixodes crenulatus]WQB40572.1 ATP synthase F0 subunit 8 [Ixodes crenulatus]
MPQIFPMNWNILTILFFTTMLMNFIFIFFIPMKLNKFYHPNKYSNKPHFKW